MIYASANLEKKLWKKGYKLVCGIDEVGRGCFAGPVVAAAVIFKKNSSTPKGVADSKLLKPKQREALSKKIKQNAHSWAISEISASIISKVGIGKASQMAFRKALRLLSVQADYILIDAFYIKHLDRTRQLAVKKGDQICASIAAASIIAKVYRDRLMRKLSKAYPEYQFGRHKGYGTKYHQEAIRKYGLSKIHRTSFNLSQFML